MDKIEITAKEIEQLLKWRDEHVEFVRHHPTPLKAVEIVITDNGYRIKGFRDDDDLRLHLNINGRSVGKCEFIRRADGMFATKPGKIRFDKNVLGKNPQVHGEMVQSMLTVYCSLMALMAFARVEPDKDAEDKPVRQRVAHKPSAKGSKKPTKQITYILRSHNGTLYAAPRGSHASPSGVFSVRGHFRHYRDGKIVWIAEYTKGTGKKKKSKVYRVGGVSDDRS